MDFSLAHQKLQLRLQHVNHIQLHLQASANGDFRPGNAAGTTANEFKNIVIAAHKIKVFADDIYSTVPHHV